MLEDSIPLFPLPNVVLFPQAVMPLHIFEPRYRAMVADALGGSQQLAIAMLRPGYEQNYLGKPAIEPVVCVGKIVAHQLLDDGRYHLVLGGTGRARIIRELTEMPYRSAVLEPIPDLSDDGTVSPAERAVLSRIFSTGPVADTEMGKQFVELLSSETPVGVALDLLAFHFEKDSTVKQAVLNETDPARRYAMLTPTMMELTRESDGDNATDAGLN